ncbi:unnamed protein product [Brugia timori]|uniref:Small basic protein n=1 Tax=Brugia timori TaxID=42155 RepID=A0A0R3QAG8_9BILA|nr:unnamed protein product [Brugia timori]
MRVRKRSVKKLQEQYKMEKRKTVKGQMDLRPKHQVRMVKRWKGLGQKDSK